jgi:hypothetical protein
MTNAQAARMARQIPFNPNQRLAPEIRQGLERIAAKQLRRIAIRPFAAQTRAALREQLGHA